MGGRPSKPTNLIEFEKKSHRTKAEIEHRKENEKAMYTGFGFKESDSVKKDIIAHKTFLFLKKLYNKIEFIDGLDEFIINRYCVLISECNQIETIISDIQKAIEQCEEVEPRLSLYGSYIKANAQLYKHREMSLKLEDRLLLNPASRIRAVPKTPPKKEESKMGGFVKNLRG